MNTIDEIEKRINAGDKITIEPDGTVRDMTPGGNSGTDRGREAATRKGSRPWPKADLVPRFRWRDPQLFERLAGRRFNPRPSG